jgi:hypothetical protein
MMPAGAGALAGDEQIAEAEPAAGRHGRSDLLGREVEPVIAIFTS